MFFKKKAPVLGETFDIKVTNYLTDGLLVFDKNSRVILFNPRAEMFFEVIEANVLGKSILELSRYERLSPVVSLLGGGIKPIEKQELDIKGNLIIEVTSVPITHNREKINTLVIVHDVTREKLSDKMKSDFVTLAAHQLRTPTSAIKWSLESLIEEEHGKITEDQRDIIQKAYNTNDKVIELVRDLLDVAQIEEGKYLNKLTFANLEDVIKSVLNTRTEEITRKKLHVEFERVEIPRLMLDTEKMDMAIGNILDNAIRYTKQGGKIIIRLENNNKEIGLQIQDNGVGIPLGEQERVFSKFFRGSNVMKMETEGTGLGLYISKNIIEAHGGRIWFESKERQGTIFFIVLPIKERFGEFLNREFY